MPTITITGVYYHRTAWVASNWSRMLTAHNSWQPSKLYDAIHHGTFNVQIDSVEGDSTSIWIPPVDDICRTIAHEIGVARGSLYSDGSDFLTYGNYINPRCRVVSINGTPVTNGRLYYAGSGASFALGPPGAISRHSLEILADEQISSFGLTSGDPITVVIEIDPAVLIGSNTINSGGTYIGGGGDINFITIHTTDCYLHDDPTTYIDNSNPADLIADGDFNYYDLEGGADLIADGDFNYYDLESGAELIADGD